MTSSGIFGVTLKRAVSNAMRRQRQQTCETANRNGTSLSDDGESWLPISKTAEMTSTGRDEKGENFFAAMHRMSVQTCWCVKLATSIFSWMYQN
jgi:hypothetical protein